MKELNRQFVIFGEFKSIVLNNINRLDEIKNKYKFQINAVPDMLELPTLNVVGQPPFAFNSNPVDIRPIFQTLDMKTNVFFGSKRIHIEQLNQETDSYSNFNSMAVEIIKAIMLAYKDEIKVNRVALNGQISGFDETAMDKIYSDTFKKSSLYGEHSKEWQFRVNTVFEDSTLKSSLNKIVSFMRGTVYDNKKSAIDTLIAVYDLNTIRNNDKVFTVDEIDYFNNLGCQYRNSIIK